MTTSAQKADQNFFGLAEAIVADNEDPLGEGRVQLTYPWLNQSMRTEWCRVCQLYAGNGYGALFVPEKNDEVLVAFVHGDMRTPVVLGGLYNGKDKPPTKREPSPGLDQKMIRTKGKHALTLDDSPNQKKIELHSSGDQVLVLDDQNRNVRIETGKGQSITLEQSGNSITLKTNGGQSISLDGSGTVTISGSTKVKLSASQVDLGLAAVEPVLLGTTLLTFLKTHTHPVALAATGPPVPMPFELALSKTVKVQA